MQAADLALVAGPDELWDGIGYKLALLSPGHDRLADFRVLVIDTHPLCPTAASVKAAVETLSDRLGKTGCTVMRTSPAMPNLARTTRDYDELLAAIFSTHLSPDERALIEAATTALSRRTWASRRRNCGG